MSDPDLLARIAALEARAADVNALEERVAHLEDRLSRARRSSGPRPSGGPGRPRPDGPRQRPSAPPGLRVNWAEAKSEDVLGKVGIALFLVGVLFLLKEALDRNWLTEAVRVGGAGVLGMALVAVGMKLRRQRPVIGRLLTGGGIATLYGALWTAGVLYPLLPAVVALAGMAGVAAFALVLASREDDAALSVVGTLGALMTPALLYRDGGQMTLLVGYLAVVMIGAGIVYWRQGWAALVGAASGGGWAVVLVAWVVGIWPEMVEASGADRVAFSLGAVIVWLATGVLPVLRRQRLGAVSEPLFDAWPSLVRPVTLAVLAAPLALVGFVDAAWSWTPTAFVGITLGLAVLYAVASRGVKPLAGPLVLASAALVGWAIGRALGIDDARLSATLVALGCVLVWTARRDGQRDVALVGHALAMSAALVLVAFLTLAVGFPFEGLTALSPAAFWRTVISAVIGAGALGYIGFTSGRTSSARGFHLTAAHLVIIAWLRVALGPMENGTALTSAAWGVYGIALVVVGLRLGDDLVRSIGLGTVLVTVAKVLLFDLAQVPGLWRILLFMGLGGLLLLVSYLVPGLLRGRPGGASGAEDSPPPPPGDGFAEPPLPPVPASREEM